MKAKHGDNPSTNGGADTSDPTAEMIDAALDAWFRSDAGFEHGMKAALTAAQEVRATQPTDNTSAAPSEGGGVMGQALRSRRFNSRSTASRTKSVRSSPSSRTDSILANVPSGNRACMSSAHFFSLPMNYISYELLTVSRMRYITHIRN